MNWRPFHFLSLRLNNTQNEVASEEMPVSLIDAEKMLKELEDLKVLSLYLPWRVLLKLRRFNITPRIVSCIKKIPVDLLTQEELLAFSIYPWLK